MHQNACLQPSNHSVTHENVLLNIFSYVTITDIYSNTVQAVDDLSRYVVLFTPLFQILSLLFCSTDGAFHTTVQIKHTLCH